MGMRMRRKLMMMGAALPPLQFLLPDAGNALASTFTASAAIRTDPKGVWAGALLSQTKFDGSGTGDVISLGRGTVISGYWYPTFDPNQGNIPLLWTPEKDRTAAQTNDEYLFYISAAYWLRYEHDQQRFVASVGTQTFNIAYTTVAGTPVGLILSYDCNNKANVDGTNYARFAIGDTLTFGITTQPTVSAPDATIYIGSNVGTLNANGVIAGLHISRDPVWYDGTYGVDLDGGRDIINLIYAAGAYADPAEITKGGWGYALGIPTNATPGALVTGTGHAWSMNHAGNLLGVGGFMLDGTYTNDGWAAEGVPDSVAALAAAEKMYPGGYKVTTSGANIGIYKDISVTAGDNFAQRALAYSDGTSVPKMVFYDVDNAAEIGSITSDVANRAANGTFASDTLWTKGGAYATIPGGNIARVDGSQVAISNAFTQTIGNQLNGGLVTGVKYNTTFTISGYSAGNFRITLSNGSTTGVGTWRGGDGTFTESLIPSTAVVSIYLQVDADFIGDISNVTVTRTATKAHPDNMLFTAQAPAGCSTIRVKLINTDATASDVTYWHQASALTNLWTDPSFEAGTAVTDIGTPTTSAQSAEQAHSGSNSWKLVADAANEGFSRTITAVVGTFYPVGGWIYAATSGTVDLEVSGGTLQKGSGLRVTTVNNAWQYVGAVVRATSTSLVVKFTSNAAQTFYVDDVGVLGNTAVSLTVTPASQANSLEGTGIRVDGKDTLKQPSTTSLKANKGTIRFSATARHNPANWVKFGKLQGYLLDMYEDANNYLRVYISAANTMTIAYNAKGAGAVTATYNATGVSFAGVLKQYIVSYGSGGAILNIGGAVVATAAGAVAFATAPTNDINFGVKNDGTLPFDGVIAPY